MVSTLDLDLIERSTKLELYNTEKCLNCSDRPNANIVSDENGHRVISIKCRCGRLHLQEKIDKFITSDSVICTPANLLKVISCEIDIPEVGRKVKIFWKHRGYLVPIKWDDGTDILVFVEKVEIERHIRLWFRHPNNTSLTYNLPVFDHCWKYAEREVKLEKF